MKDSTRIGIIVLALVMLVALSINLGRRTALSEDTKYTLKTYTGVGSGVYKHGTIVKVVDGKPVVVGNFHDDSGKDYPGTVEIVEVK